MNNFLASTADERIAYTYVRPQNGAVNQSVHMTPEDGLPFRTERQLAHSQPNDVQTRVTHICIKWPGADYESFLGPGVAHNPHRYLKARETFEKLSRIGRDIPIFIGSRLK